VVLVVAEAATEADADTDHDIIGVVEDTPLFMMVFPITGEDGVL
jgi:hypothetical protein